MNEVVAPANESESAAAVDVGVDLKKLSVFEENEVELRHALSDLDAEVRSAWGQWLRYVNEEIDGRLTNLLTEAARVHGKHLDRLSSFGEAERHAGSVLEYRRAVENDVVELLLNGFEKRNIGRALETAFDACVGEVRTAGENLPGQIRLPQPSALFEPEDGDGPVIAVRKFGRRKWLGLSATSLAVRNRVRRVLRRKELRPVPPNRIVDVRKLVGRHLGGEISENLATVYEGVQTRIARRIANVEKALTVWVNSTLTEERAAEILLEGQLRPRWDAVQVTTKAVESEVTSPGNDKSAPSPATKDEGDSEVDEVTTTDFFDRILTIGKELQTILEVVASDRDAHAGDDLLDARGSAERADADDAGVETANRGATTGPQGDGATESTQIEASDIEASDDGKVAGAIDANQSEVARPEDSNGTMGGAESEDAAIEADPFSEAFARLRSDLDHAGTFLLRASNQSAEVGADVFVSRHWGQWYDQVVDRLNYLDLLLLIRDRMLKAESSIVDRTARATVVSVINTFVDMKKHFSDSRREASVAKGGLRSKQDLEKYAAVLASLRDRLTIVLASIFRDLPGLVSSDQALSDPGREEWRGLGKFVDDLPDSLVMHELYDEDEEISSHIRKAEVNFRGLVNDVLLIQLPDRLRKPAEGLRASVRSVWTDTEQVQHIVQYNIDAAIDELHEDRPDDGHDAMNDGSEESKKGPATPSERIAQAFQLTDDGLARASGTLNQLAMSLRPPWEEFVDAIDRELREDWVAIHRRLKAADSADEQWAGYRARTTRQLERIFGRVRSTTLAMADRIGKVLKAGRRRAQSLIRIGQTAVGVADGGETARYETIDAISSVGELRNGLPLIYRRLFSFDPLDETSLLEGRSRDLVWTKTHFARWHRSMQLGVVLIQAPLGSGRTSFLNALRSVVFKDYDVKVINIQERLYHPDEFAVLVAGALGIGKPGITLDELEEYLLQTKRSDPPHVCLVDNFEHLLIRAPQAVNVIERVILFMSHTDSTVYWLGTIGALAWQFLSKTAGTAVSFVDSYALTPMDRTTIESLIINRHRRSGMPLHFQETQEQSALMRQRLRRAKTPDQRQGLLREDFFDRLWKASGENIMLALYYWIRSLDFSSDEGTLTVQPLKPLNFEFVQQFDLDHAFTLKAFFLHKTLSLDDHCRIFHMSLDASTALLESLLNTHVIEPVPHSERASSEHHVHREAIYRLKPLLFHPVTMLLQGKNIVY